MMPLPHLTDWAIGPDLEDGAWPRMNGVLAGYGLRVP